MKKVIVITGTPGTGKTTISGLLKGRMKNAELIKANDLVKSLRLYTSRAKEGEFVVNMPKLKGELERRIKKSRAETIILEGHILCDIKIKGAIAIVIREHLKTTEKRMKLRHYSKKKIEDNIVSEAVDYCGINAENNYSKVYEVMGGRSAVRNILNIMEGRTKAVNTIEMLSELNRFLK